MQTSHISSRIAFVGVGRMGANMARRLCDQGYQVTAVRDVDQSWAQQFAAEIGAEVPPTLAQLTDAANVIITVVSDDAAMEAIYASTGDSLCTNAAGRLFINCATITPAVHVRVAERVAAAGGATIEACMASSIPQARNGTLYLICGGDEAAYQRAQPILATLGDARFVGGPGRAAQIKALVNMLMNINTAALAEALGVAAGLGLDLDLLRDIFAQTGAKSRVLETDGPDMQTRDHEVYFSAAHAAKDSGIALELAREIGVSVPLAAVTKERYDQVVRLGFGDQDKSVIAELTFPNRAGSGQ